MVDASFQSENIVAQVVEVLSNFLQPIDKDNEDTLIQIKNATIHSTRILSEYEFSINGHIALGLIYIQRK